MKDCNIIWVFTVCKSTLSCIQRVKVRNVNISLLTKKQNKILRGSSWIISTYTHGVTTVKPVLSSDSKGRPKSIFNIYYRLMQVKGIAECFKGSILQYFWPALSYHLSLRSLFCLFLSDRSRQVLLYYLAHDHPTAGLGLNRLYNALCLVMKYSLWSSAPSYTVHNKHKTLINLYYLILMLTYPFCFKVCNINRVKSCIFGQTAKF